MNTAIEQLIRESIYDTATKESIRYKDFEVYAADFAGSQDEPIAIGPPAFILANGNEARWANLSEGAEIFNVLTEYLDKNKENDLPDILKRQKDDDNAD